MGVLRPPETVLFGDGMIDALPEMAGRFGDKILICTDKIVSAFSVVSSIIDQMRAGGATVVVFEDTAPELPVDCVHDCMDRQEGFVPDVVIGIGGGSCVDLAKLVALALRHGRELDQFYGENLVPSATIPVIAVPTTAGTGSEATPVAVLDDKSRELKVGISSRFLVPKIALVDPALTATCPAGLSAASGADALTHAIEAFTAVQREPSSDLEAAQVFVGKNDLSDQFAREAITLISDNLETVVKDGANLGARNRMAYGAMLAGMAFGAAGTSAAHAIQYPIGALTKTAHGLGVAALMPYVMAYNRPSCTTEFAQIATAMGFESGTESERADRAVFRVAELFAAVGIPKTLPELGVTKDQLDWIVDHSLLPARLVNNNPRPLERQGIQEIVNDAMTGEINLRSEM